MIEDLVEEIEMVTNKQCNNKPPAISAVVKTVNMSVLVAATAAVAEVAAEIAGVTVVTVVTAVTGVTEVTEANNSLVTVSNNEVNNKVGNVAMATEAKTGPGKTAQTNPNKMVAKKANSNPTAEVSKPAVTLQVVKASQIGGNAETAVTVEGIEAEAKVAAAVLVVTEEEADQTVRNVLQAIVILVNGQIARILSHSNSVVITMGIMVSLSMMLWFFVEMVNLCF